jgi:Flp pilus assembly protein TadG
MTRLASMCARLGRMLRERDGTSAVEFAIVAPFLVALLVPIVDLGMGFYTKMQVQNAAQAGVQYAILRGWNSSAIQNAETAATTLSSITALPAPTQSCNCLSGTSMTAISCSSTCPDGSTPGVYVTVNAQASYSTLVPYPQLDSPVTLKAQSTVRIQ